MTNQEFSDGFSTLLNSFNTQAQFGEESSKREIVLDEYEKSVLLTQAQDIIVKSYFDGALNSQGQGFDDSTRRQVDFSSLIKVADLDVCSDATKKEFDERGLMFKLPLKKDSQGNPEDDTSDVLFILNEKVVCTEITGTSPATSKKFNLVVVPISYKEYDREMSKPFAQPLKKQAWRLFQNNATGYDIDTELILKQSIRDKYTASPAAVGDVGVVYRIRYVRRPRPIVLETMPEGLTIDGITAETSCELNPILHMDILNKAVELAITTRGGGQAPSSNERDGQPQRR